MSNDAHPPDEAPSLSETTGAAAKRQPLNSIQRRVAGVLIEKAKTTPEQYPLTLNSLTTGCNQKSNRDPQMNLSVEQVEEALEGLRQLGAVVELQSGGRVPKYKHCFYEWLGVDKVELAVMAELLLRGEQTVGELRGRAARMEPITDLHALRPILRSLVDKGLVVEITPEGRGQTVTHALYREKEMAELRARCHTEAHAQASTVPSVPAEEISSDTAEQMRAAIAEIRVELQQLREEVRQLREKHLDSGEHSPG